MKEKEQILGAKNPLMIATEVIYEAIDRRIQLLAEHTKYPCRYLILMGGILINADHDMGSFTDIKRFNVVNLETGDRHDLLEELMRGYER